MGGMGGYSAPGGIPGAPSLTPVYGNAPPPLPYGPAKQKNPTEDVKKRKLFVGAIGGMTE